MDQPRTPAPIPTPEIVTLPRRRVLLCAFACDPHGRLGGEDILGWNVVNQIARFHDAWVITSVDNRDHIKEALKENPSDNPRYCYFGVPKGHTMLWGIPGVIQFYTYLWQAGIYFAARRLHKRHKFDLFHHVTFANDWMASFVGALLPVPYVRGPGGGAQKVPAAFLRDYTFIGRVWERLRSIGQWLFRHDPFFVRGQQRASAILLCNPETMASVPDRWQPKVSLFPVNGVNSHDIQLLSPQMDKPAEDTFKVFSAGRLIRLKGFHLAIRAFAPLAAKSPDVVLEIVGDGPEEAFLRDLIRQSGLEGRVRLLPWMNRDDYLRTLCGCDVFLFTSLRDGGGAVVVEAMAAGKPVVCLDLGGPALHVTQGCGIKVPADNPDQSVNDLAQALESLYDNRDLRCRMAESARRRANGIYHWDRLGERLNDIYRQALGPETAGANLPEWGTG